MIADLPIPESTDGELLFRFARRGSEEAFRRLVERHGRLVAGVCRRVLRHEQDVEDAFQATFLVLVRRADQLRKRESVASWLFRVAHRVALRAADRRHRSPGDDDGLEPTARDGSPADVADREEFEILAVELNRLPETYRLPLILHYLEGRSRTDTAELLDSTEASVKARLARGRRMLRRRLMRRGVALSVALAALSPTSSWAALVDGALAAAVPSTTPGATGATPTTVSLAKGLTTMSLPTLKFSTVLGTTVAAGLLVAAGVALSQPPVERGRNGGDVIDSRTVSETDAEREDTVEAVAADDVAIDAAPADTVAETTADAVDSAVDDTTVDERKPRLRDPFAPGARNAADAIEAVAEREQDGLDKVVELRLEQVPLSDVLELVSRSAGLNIVLDSLALRQAGLDPKVVWSAPVNIEVSGVTARSALKLILAPYDLTHVAEDEVLKIVPSEAVVRNARWSRMPIDLVESNRNEERIRETLEAVTEVEFVDTPLSDAIEFLADLHNLQIHVEENTLSDAGVDMDAPVNLAMNLVTLESTLNVMLAPLDLAYVVEDEVLKVTSREAAEARRDVRVYPVGPLLDADVLEAETMAELLLREDPAEQSGVTAVAHGRFVTITQSPLGHRRTRAILEQLKRAAALAEEEATY